MNKPYKKLAVGTLFGAAIGYIAGILTAPKPGAQTREELKTAWQDNERQLKALHTDLNDMISEARERSLKLKGNAQARYKETLDTAQKAKEKARVLISSIHEGDTEDKDAKAVIEEARKALESLKTYFQK